MWLPVNNLLSLGGPVLKNWKPRKVIAFLKKNGFVEIKTKKRSTGDHSCLLNRETTKYTEVDMGNKSFSAREMLTMAKQSGIERKDWLVG